LMATYWCALNERPLWGSSTAASQPSDKIRYGPVQARDHYKRPLLGFEYFDVSAAEMMLTRKFHATS
jgi:hypothetical protein